jgi:hypothetical protein
VNGAAVALKAASRLPSLGLCGRWILTLLLRGEPNVGIRSALAADDLPYPGDDVLNQLRAEHVPKRFTYKSSKGKAITQTLGVTMFFDGTPEAEQALDLLRHPRAREMTEAGILTGVPNNAIAQTLEFYQGVVVPVTVIELYKAAFFDTGCVTRAQLRVLLQHRVRIAVLRMVNDVGDEATARRAIRSDARTAAMNMPSSPLAWAAVLLTMGYSPSRFELPRVVAQMENIATLRVSEALLRGGRDDERRAAGYASVLQTLSGIKQAVVPPDAALEKKLRVLRLRTEERSPPTVGDLRAAGGEVTVDNGPPLGSRGDEDEDV